ncbi:MULTISPECIES: DUF4247 domain-containing protein [Actinomadura]|uniref:DUF4247 domain-containing protein n=1 Tax=Actinomadura yumaensis TaxID=111807 RepID=A0ABW2C9Y6_9ACTN|nr:hypothetical protein [Actinomadura sp. J1-007]
MTRRHYVIGAVAVAVIAVIVLVVVLVNGDDSPDEWVSEKYRKVAAGTFHASKPPRAVAGEITKKFHAIDRVDALGFGDAPAGGTGGTGGTVPGTGGTGGTVPGAAPGGGIFLQYPKTVIGVLPDGPGSRITVDRPSSGYSRYHSYVGGRWSAPGRDGWNSNGRASFRGGGPGSGK